MNKCITECKNELVNEEIKVWIDKGVDIFVNEITTEKMKGWMHKEIGQLMME